MNSKIIVSPDTYLISIAKDPSLKRDIMPSEPVDLEPKPEPQPEPEPEPEPIFPVREDPVQFVVLGRQPTVNKALNMNFFKRNSLKQDVEDVVRWALVEHGIKDGDGWFPGYFGIKMVAYFDSGVRPDLDGLGFFLKCALDACEGVLYENDRKCIRQCSELALEKSTTRFEFEVYPCC